MLAVTVLGGRDGAIAVSRALAAAGIGVAELRVEAQSLERRYLDLTQGVAR